MNGLNMDNTVSAQSFKNKVVQELQSLFVFSTSLYPLGEPLEG
jgi:hypothetical protein